MNNFRSNIVRFNEKFIKKYSANLSSYQRQRFTGYLYTIFTLFAISFFGVFAINPAISTIANLQKQYEDGKVTEAKLDQKITALQHLNTQYQQIYPFLDLINGTIPSSSRIPYLTKQIENLNQQDNLTLVKVETGTTEIYPAVRKPGGGNYSFTFSTYSTGLEVDIYKYISDIINLDRILTIDTIDVNSAGDKSGAFGVSITGKAYFSK